MNPYHHPPLLEADQAQASGDRIQPEIVHPITYALAFYVSFSAACCVSLPMFAKLPLYWCALIGPWLAMGHGVLPTIAGMAALHLSVLLSVPICTNRRAESHFMFALAIGLWTMSGVFGGMILEEVRCILTSTAIYGLATRRVSVAYITNSDSL